MIEAKKITPLKSIRKYCLACSSRPKDVRECQSADCPLYQYRMGNNPARSGIGPDKHLRNGCFAAKNIHSPSVSSIGSGGGSVSMGLEKDFRLRERYQLI